MEGRGPDGWVHLNATRVLYPEAGVEAFVTGLTRRREDFNFPGQAATAKTPASGGAE
jgi:hypothetical protein